MKTRSPVSPLNRALYDRLKGAMTTPVYDYVPNGKKAPYIALTDTTARGWYSKTISGAEVRATVKILSEQQGDKEVAGLADRAITAVTASPLVLTEDWRVVRTEIEQHSVERQEAFREATIQFKFIIIDTKE